MKQTGWDVEVLTHDLIILLDELLSLPPQQIVNLASVALEVLLEGALALEAGLLYLFLHLGLMFRFGGVPLFLDYFGDHVVHILDHWISSWLVNDAQHLLSLLVLVEGQQEVSEGMVCLRSIR